MTQVETSTAAVQRRKLWLPFSIAAVSVAVAAAAVVALWPKQSGLDKLAARDEQGAEACGMLATWLRGDLRSPYTGQNEDKASVSLLVSGRAAAATTPAIRDAVGATAVDEKTLAMLRAGGYFAHTPRVTHLQNLHAGCAGAGVEMPAYTDSPKRG
ncbi:hypothetical protein HC028_20345 [Planosporangium flavigriseum]|uniref:Uncharacterized protein n=1 Tax=Planosporangium flavigriseum TaxID=373681 RepID=A0A8J3LMH4_9ACTN|nr:hypothetical protein [Planosporangium flavigriseum]NJC66837.1 hypothetical protein [Planosporangium flavigriseum]GIG74422.1 hypothetical protein Pfl04_28260 [Planosporangium flavigriseum]